MTKRILLCDDEFPIAKAAGLKLAKAGYAVETCHDGQAGWEAYLAGRPDLLVTGAAGWDLWGRRLESLLSEVAEDRRLHTVGK